MKTHVVAFASLLAMSPSVSAGTFSCVAPGNIVQYDGVQRAVVSPVGEFIVISIWDQLPQPTVAPNHVVIASSSMSCKFDDVRVEVKQALQPVSARSTKGGDHGK